MKKTTTITILLVLILFVSLQAVAQTKSSATQTVTFAVMHSAAHTLNTLANSQGFNTNIDPPGMTAFQNSLEKINLKVTVGKASTNMALKNNSINNHVDIRSIFQEKKSDAPDGRPSLVTVTE